MDKSYVTMEQYLCLVCAEPYDTGALLLDKQLKNRFDSHTITSNGLCPEHRRLYDSGYVAIVGVDREKSNMTRGTNSRTIKPGDAYRTGKIAFLRRNAYQQMFDVAIDDDMPVVFADDDVINELNKRYEETHGHEPFTVEQWKESEDVDGHA